MSPPPSGSPWSSLAETLAAHRPDGSLEARDVARVAALAGGPDPWGRDRALHVTCSALVLHPPTGEVLLRWHDRLGRWQHVGGHGEPGEDRPFAVARREAVEETGLDDLLAWPDPARPALVQVAVVPVPARPGEAAHEHADLRYLLATATPGDARAETASTPLRWMTVAAAAGLVGRDDLAPALARVAELLDGSSAFPSEAKTNPA